ncbi:MAG: pfkB carbohydrate kinase family protein [Alphaproteobacteria bacterium]|nr:pfkB carbohydrate kinase family protein [Alphaproteobacteria bacterium]
MWVGPNKSQRSNNKNKKDETKDKMSKNTHYDVTAVGNAIVDMIALTDENFLAQYELTKGMMTLVDRETSQRLLEAHSGFTQQSGGSGANTIAGIASLGGKCAYIGKVANDEQGNFFRKDMEKLGVDFATSTDPESDVPTARCLSFVTPDADRTMATYLGISTEIAPDDLDAAKIRNAKVTYLEGYLFDKDLAKEAFHAASILAHTSGNLVSLTLSDPFCVGRHREDFKNLVNGHVDILFANEQEVMTLYETDNVEQAIARIGDNVDICAITHGAKGATVLFHGKKFEIPAMPVTNLVDTTGAGDLFAAGFLYGFTQDMNPYQCGLLGAKAAAEVIAQMGARPANSLKALLADH